MPTTRGWAALGAGVALIVLWVVFGERLMLGVGLFLVVAIGSGVAYVRSTVPNVGVSRHVTPFQVHDGDRAIVELTLSTSRRIHQAVVLDEVSGLGTARFVADRVEPHHPMVARYEVLCRPRGVYTVGPAVVQVRDPLALSEAGGTAGKININTAPERVVSALKGITPKLARNVVRGIDRDGRAKLKPYKEASDILAVAGITPDMYSDFCNLITTRSDQFRVAAIAQTIEDVDGDGNFDKNKGDRIFSESCADVVVDRGELTDGNTDTKALQVFH